MIDIRLNDYLLKRNFIILILAIVLGLLITINPILAIIATTTALLIVSINSGYSWLAFEIILLFVLVIPTGWGSENLLMGIPIGNISLSLQILLPIFLSVLVLATYVSKRAIPKQIGDTFVLHVSKTLVFWIGSGMLIYALGIRAYGLVDASRDFQYVLMYLSILAASIIYSDVYIAWPRVIRIMMVGMLLYSLLTVLIFLSPNTLRFVIYGDYMWANTVRVGFSTSSLFVIFIPLYLMLISSNTLQGWWKAIGILTIIFMIISLFISQGRMLLACTFLNSALVLFGPRLRSPRLIRSRTIIYLCFICVIFFIAIGITVGMNSSNLIWDLTYQFSDRLTSIISYFENRSLLEKDLLARSISNQAAWRMWQEGSVLIGKGYGAQLGLYTPSGDLAQRGPFIDNLWATLAVKGGLVALVTYGLLLLTSFYRVLRAIRFCTDEHMKIVLRTFALSFPGFIILTTISSAHLLVSPSVILAFAVIVAFATNIDKQPSIFQKVLS